VAGLDLRAGPMCRRIDGTTTTQGANMQAIWNNTVLAQSADTVVVEGNHYFPRTSVKDEFVTSSDHQTRCPWKGEASYLHVTVGDDVNRDAAWYYPEPKAAAAQIRDRVAFWKGVKVID
jgi:uncharacterized protein (DUF427 family)